MEVFVLLQTSPYTEVRRVSSSLSEIRDCFSDYVKWESVKENVMDNVVMYGELTMQGVVTNRWSISKHKLT